MSRPGTRRLPAGAEADPDGGTHFRVWAPRATRVSVDICAPPGAAGSHPLAPDGEGYFAGRVAGVGAGARYGFRLDDGPRWPDPVSRFQPDGPHGPSEVVDPGAFPWTDAAWGGVDLAGQVLYELHVGTFTPEGTWATAARELPELAGAGVTVIEMMPVAEFSGTFGWGYDGVCIYAPTRLYGRPDDLRRFVDRAHAVGLGVVLDVVYNHLGPDGNYLARYAEGYFTDRHRTDWGPAIDFDGPEAAPVREFFVGNAGYWVDEYHVDGVRLDATQDIHDGSADHVIAAIVRRVREKAGRRRTIVVAENEPQSVRLARPAAAGGFGVDGVWSDDFHHSARVAVTGRTEAYYRDYRGTPQELVSAAKRGYLYQGQWYAWQGKPRGTPTAGLPPAAFVTYLQNHDQVANSPGGLRLSALTSPGRHRAITALLLLGPGTPLLFQGQEFAASSPFLFFADLPPGLAPAMRAGRAQFLAQFPSLAGPDAQAALADPASRAAFERSKLDLGERERHAPAYALHRDLLALRRGDPVLRSPRPDGVDGAVLGPEAFLLRFFGGREGDRLLVVNLGRDLRLESVAEPLLAPPEGAAWRMVWSSQHVRYGGAGAVVPELRGGVLVPAETALVLAPGGEQP